MRGVGYYEAVAQIIPILFLALTIGEGRVRVRETLSPRTVMLGAMFVGAVLLAGEVAALKVVQGDAPSNGSEFLTSISLAMGFGLILRYLGGMAYKDRTGEDSEDAPGRLTAVLDGAMVVVIVVVYFVLMA